jgi:hypothetical protein
VPVEPLPTSQPNRKIAMRFNSDDPKTWDCFRPLIIAHDVGRSRDRSTAVIGGLPAFNPNLIAIQHAHELPQGLYGSARASELATIDRHYESEGLIIADLSTDATYAEPMRSKIRRCWFTLLAAPICSSCSIPCCSLIRSELPIDQAPGALTSSLWRSRQRCARAGRSTGARQASTMISPYHAPC